MGRLRRGPGGPAERRVGKLRQAALRGAQEVLEDELAVGLQPISDHCPLLLGHGARPWGHPNESGEWETSWTDWWSKEVQDKAGGQIRTLPLVMCQEPAPVPKTVETAGGFKVVPAPEELVRLEGHHWATRWDKGRGSVYRLDQFGRRGEGVLVPDFCCLEEPESSSCIHFGTEKRDVSWLAEGLQKLAESRFKKMPINELIHHIQSCPSLILMAPVARWAFKTAASIKNFSRRAARRFPFYINSIEMGARLQISVVPPLNTHSGEPDCLDVKELEKIGAQLFPLSNTKGRLCVRQFGGPPLQLDALGSQLEDICNYIAVDWADSLFASPKTWARLFVNVQPCGDLEASLGHVPGRGLFSKRMDSWACFCGEPAVGSEVLDYTAVPVCAECGAFVRGAEVFLSKQGLSQYTSRPAQELVGSFDCQFDDALTGPNEMISWAEPAEDSAVLAAGGMISLKPPKRGWPEEVRKELHKQLQMLIGCPSDALHITMTATEADTPNLMVTFVMIHPAVLNAGRAHPPVEGSADPKIPLRWYQQLEVQLKQIATSQTVRSQWTKTVEDRAVPLLFISDAQRVVLPCSLFLLKNDRDCWQCSPAHTEIQDSKRTSAASAIPGQVGQWIDLIRERLAPKDGIDRRRQSLDMKVQRRKSVQQRRATVAELVDAKQLTEMSEVQLLRKLSEDASRRQSLKAEEQAAGKEKEAEAAEADDASSSSASSASSSAEDASSKVGESQPGSSAQNSGTAAISMEDLVPAPGPEQSEEVQMEATSKSDPSQEASQFILDPVVMAVLRFQPSVEQLALRLRDLVAQAAWEGQAQRVESLLNRWGGANAAWAIAGRSSDFGGQSSLDLSVKACNYHVTHVLMKHMPSQLEDELVDVLNEHNPVTGHSLLYAAVRYSSRRTAFVVQELIRRRADVNGRGSCRPTSEAALVHCVRRADISLIESLLEHRALVNIVGEDGKTLLQTAVARGDALILSCLLNTEGCDVNMLDRYQRSALASALGKSHHPVLVQILLDAKCSAVHLDCDGMQPLAHAIGLQDQRIYQSLLLRRADPNAIAVPARDKQTRLLHFAATRRDEVMVKCLLNAEADPNLKAKHDRTVLGLTIGLQLSEETVNLILEKRADPNARFGLRGGETPLRMAVLTERAATVKLLLCARADPGIGNLAGCSAFTACLAGPQTWLFDAPERHVSRDGRQLAESMGTHPMHMASTWRKARWRPRVGRPSFVHTQEVTDFDIFDFLFPSNLPPISKKFGETR